MAEQSVTLQPGESKQVSFEAIPREAKLYHVSVDGLTGSFMAVAAPLAGTIDPGQIWHEPLTAWEFFSSGREIPLNEAIHLNPLWVNRSEINIVGHMSLVITYPDGTRQTLSAISNQDKEAGPGSGWYVQFAPFLSTQEGTYTLEATLSSAGQVLDSMTFTLVAVAVAIAEFYMPPQFTKAKITSRWTFRPYYYVMKFECPITNNGNAARTHTVVVSNNHPGDLPPWSLEFTLNPGETYLWKHSQLAIWPMTFYLDGDWAENNHSQGAAQ